MSPTVIRVLHPGVQLCDAFLQKRLSDLMRSVNSGKGGGVGSEGGKVPVARAHNQPKNDNGSVVPAESDKSPNVRPVTTILSNFTSGSGGGGVYAKASELNAKNNTNASDLVTTFMTIPPL